MRILATTTLLALLAGLSGCADKSSGIAVPERSGQPQIGGNPQLGGPGVGGHAPASGAPTDPADRVHPSVDHPVAGRPSDGPQDPPEPVPEPGTILLFGVGLTGLAVYRRRRRDSEAPDLA